MKGLILATMLFAVSLVCVEGVRGQAPPASRDSLRLKVDGMVCSVCAYGVERRLEKLDQVEQVKVSLDSARVVVFLKPGAMVSDSTLAEEVRKAGFALRGVERFTPDKKPGS